MIGFDFLSVVFPTPCSDSLEQDGLLSSSNMRHIYRPVDFFTQPCLGDKGRIQYQDSSTSHGSGCLSRRAILPASFPPSSLRNLPVRLPRGYRISSCRALGHQRRANAILISGLGQMTIAEGWLNVTGPTGALIQLGTKHR